MENIIPKNTVKTISSEIGSKLIDNAVSDTVHGICRGVLVRALLSMDIRVDSLGGKKRGRDGEDLDSPVDEQSKEIQNYINKYWKECIVDIIFYGTVLGYFTYTVTEVEVRKGKNNKPIYVKKPYILPYNMYDVDIVLTPEFTTFNGVILKQDSSLIENKSIDRKYDPRLHCFVVPGYFPSKENAEFRSIVALALQSSTWIQQLYAAQLLAQIQRSHPPIIIEDAGTGKAAESNLLELEKLSTNLSGIKNEQNEKEAKEKYENIQNSSTFFMSLGQNGKALTPLRADAPSIGYIPTPVDALYPLPPGFKMASPQPVLPEPQPDLLNYNASRMREVCALYGIPSSSIVSETKSKTGTASTAIDDNDNLALQRSLHYWQKVIKSFFTEVYLQIRQDLAGESDVQITIPIIPYSSTSKMHEFVDRNIISTEKGKEYVAAIAGLSPDDILDGENEHLVPPIHGNENQTTALIKAKEKVMNAEAAERMAKAKAALQGEQDMSKGEMELKDKEMELEEMEFENKMKLMDKQMELEKIKTDAAMKKANAQVKVNKSAPKKTGP